MEEIKKPRRRAVDLTEEELTASPVENHSNHENGEEFHQFEDDGFIQKAKERQDDFLTYVQKIIEEYQEYSRLGENVIGFQKLNLALSSHFPIYLGLISIYNTLKIQQQTQKEIFDQWYAEVYTKVRQQYNVLSLSAQKWLSNRDLEALIRTKYRTQYQELLHNYLQYDNKLAFIEQLIKAWDGQKYTLGTLSKNIQVEYGGGDNN